MKKIPGILLIALLLGCIEPIHFDVSESPQVMVIEGSVQQGKGPHTLSISYTGELGKQVFQTIDDAQATLFNSEGETEEFVATGEGKYRTDGQIEGQTGVEYFIEVEVSGKIYRSLPEILPVKISIDNAYFALEKEEVFQEADRVQAKPYFKVYTESTLPEDQNDIFILWNLENVFVVTEIRCSPFGGPRSCYIRFPLSDQLLPVFDGTKLAPGSSFNHLIASKIVDYSFGERQTFLIFQNSITREAYDYWDKIKKVSQQHGSIFDVPPSAVKGNIYNISDPQDPVLGFFSALNTDTALISVTRFDLDEGFEQLPFCGLPGLYFRYEPACCNCLSLKNSSSDRPEYW